MEALFHFVFQLFKICILSYFYTYLFFFLLRKVSNKSNIIKSILHKIIEIKPLIFICIFFFLFSWMFSYWGNHGLGDLARIPIGNNMTIDNINGNKYGKISGLITLNGKEVETTKFRITSGKIVGNLDSWFYNYKNAYFICDINTKEVIEFPTKKTFNEFAKLERLPNSNSLRSFQMNYRLYWSTWRFFLLP